MTASQRSLGGTYLSTIYYGISPTINNMSVFGLEKALYGMQTGTTEPPPPPPPQPGGPGVSYCSRPPIPPPSRREGELLDRCIVES
jgi:hypothetical protein